MKITEITNISEVELLLSVSSLPTSDLKSNDRVQLYGTHRNEALTACIGVEVYGKAALLRSLAVDSQYKKQGIGKQLLEHIENICKQNGVKEIFLLTETAEKYFLKFGYEIYKRENAPLSIQRTTQFSTLCPSAAQLMHKTLKMT